jgi:hypothetical protein
VGAVQSAQAGAPHAEMVSWRQHLSRPVQLSMEFAAPGTCTHSSMVELFSCRSQYFSVYDRYDYPAFIICMTYAVQLGLPLSDISLCITRRTSYVPGSCCAGTSSSFAGRR